MTTIENDPIQNNQKLSENYLLAILDDGETKGATFIVKASNLVPDVTTIKNDPSQNDPTII